MLYPGLNASESAALDSVAKDLATSPEWLWEVMNFESRLNPKAANPKSSAKGLIQFLDSTAKSLGYKSSQDLVNKHPTFTSQVKGPVRAYFLPGKPYASRQSLYMKVFYPAARAVPPDTTFKTLYAKHGGNYTSFASANPGIVTVADYVNKALKNARAKWPIATVKTVAVASGGLLFLAAAATFYFLATSGTGDPA
jgi:hypothetical protein